METKILNEVEFVEASDTGMISAITGGRISKTGREQIEKAEQIIIVKAKKYLENSINNTSLYDDLFVALIVDRTGTRRPVQSRNSSWFFNDQAKAIRSIKRINKLVEIITMHESDYKKIIDEESEHFQKVIGISEKKKEQTRQEISLKIGSTMLHVNYINGVFETGFYDVIQTNKPKDKKFISETSPAAIYEVVFRSINSFSSLEEAEAFVMKENMMSFLRANTQTKLQAFLKEQNKIDEQEMEKYALMFEKEQQTS